jgi:hypothetical protein
MFTGGSGNYQLFLNDPTGVQQVIYPNSGNRSITFENLFEGYSYNINFSIDDYSMQVYNQYSESVSFTPG